MILALSVLSVLLQAASPAPAPEPPLVKPLEPLRFLLGAWESPAPAPAEASGGFAFESRLQGRVIVRTNHADYPAAGGRPASRHEDLMVVHASEEGDVGADYYDSEGHVIRYTAETGPGRLTLTSAASERGPRFRLSYALDASGALSGRFEIAAPGKPDAFAPYLAWTARRSGGGR